MVLTLDFGNTAAKFALFSEQGELINSGPFTDTQPFEQLPLTQCIFSTVRKEIPWLSNLPCPVHLFGTTMKLPIQVNYATPQSLGPDRLAAVLGAHKLLPPHTAALVIDAGTCITFDWLDNQNTYLGGAISPGIQMRYKALHQFTGKLPLVSHEPAEPMPGNSTGNSILSGVQTGIIGEINYQIQLFNEKFPHASVFLTGGDATLLSEMLKTQIFVQPLLVHYGLFHAIA